MNNELIVALSAALCLGAKVRLPAMTPPQLAILLNEVAYAREQIHGPQQPTTH